MCTRMQPGEGALDLMWAVGDSIIHSEEKSGQRRLKSHTVGDGELRCVDKRRSELPTNAMREPAIRDKNLVVRSFLLITYSSQDLL